MPARCNDAGGEFKLRCPECGRSAFSVGDDVLCPTEGRRIQGADGVLPLLRSHRAEELRPFLETYRLVRRDEGWGGGPQYYLSLPTRDESGAHRGIWKIRARSHRILLRALRERFGRETLRILDLGAGNGWLAFRLASMGHFVLATDVSTDPDDGLGALTRYAHGAAFRDRLARARADIEELPLEDGQFDAVVAAGSIHYASNPERVVAEARRVLLPRGVLVTMDSPTYPCESAGRAMVERRRTEHRARFGWEAPDPTIGFLVHNRFHSLLVGSGFRVTLRFPFEGTRRWARRAYTRLARRPIPARFPVFIAERAA